MADDWAYTFTAAKSAKGHLVIQGRPYFDRVVSMLADGEIVVLKLEPWVERKTTQQVRLIWGGIYQQILQGMLTEVGYEQHSDKAARAMAKDALHEALCLEFGGSITERVTGQTVRKFRLSKATKDQTREYIDWCARHAAQHYGVVVELPGEMLWRCQA